jgi:hypothetical protein
MAAEAGHAGVFFFVRAFLDFAVFFRYHFSIGGIK